MNYLTEQLSKTHGAIIVKTTYVFQEIINEQRGLPHSETFQQFMAIGAIEMTKILELKPNETNLAVLQSRIIDGDLARYLCDNNQFGIIAMLHFPICYSFTFTDDGEVITITYDVANYHISWIYGNTIPELVHKITRQGDVWYDYDLRKFKKSHIDQSKPLFPIKISDDLSITDIEFTGNMIFVGVTYKVRYHGDVLYWNDNKMEFYSLGIPSKPPKKIIDTIRKLVEFTHIDKIRDAISRVPPGVTSSLKINMIQNSPPCQQVKKG